MQLSRNLAMNVMSFMANVAVGIALVPYLVKHLGVGAYGFIPLAMTFSEVVAIITQSINASLNRRISIASNLEGKNKVALIYSTTITMFFILIALQSCVVYLLVKNFEFVFTVKESIISDVKNLFIFVFLSYSITMIKGVYATQLFCKNRLDLIKICEIVQLLSRFILILVLFNSHQISLSSVGIASILSALLSLMAVRYYLKKNKCTIKYKFTDFDKREIKPILHTSSWLVINQIGFLIFLKSDLFIVNNILGEEDTGVYAILVQLNTIVRSIASVLSGVLVPSLLLYYSREEFKKMNDLMISSVYLLGIVMAIPISIFIVYSNEILHVWIGSSGGESEILSWLIIISFASMLLHLPFLPLNSVLVAYNKVKIPGLISVLLGVINVVLSTILLVEYELGLYGVLYVSVALLTIKNTVFLPIYTAKIVGVPILYMYRKMMSMLVIAASFITINMLVKNFVDINPMLSILLSSTCVVVVFLFVTFRGDNFKIFIRNSM